VDAAIRISNLTKRYGDVVGVADLDLEVHTGEVFALLGANGAGKSTTIRTLLDLIRPTSGRCEVLGLDSQREAVAIHARVGYLPGEPTLWKGMTGRQLLSFFGALHGHSDLGEAEKVAERLGLDLDRRIGTHSSGNRQKAALAQAFVGRPELLVLDEPTNSLDPLVQHEFYRLVEDLQDQGRTMLLCSHVLPEVERVADRVGIIRGGRLVAVDSVADLQQKAVRRLELHFGEPVPGAEFERVPSVRHVQVDHGGRVIHLQVGGPVGPAVQVAAQHDLVNVITHEGDLESAFLAYYQADEDDDAP
jgi:beta-exotoxin I transport system ATP-binding protein